MKIKSFLIVLFAVVVSGCNPANLMPIETEEQLGEQMASQIMATNKEVQDVELNQALNEITSRLLANIKDTEYTYKIKLIEGDEVNAFTIPGGNVFVFKGLLSFADNPEQVAAVLAHEFGHVENKDVTQKLVKELGIQLLFQLVTGGDPGILAQVGRTALSTVFDRDQEKEADEFALQLLERSSVPPESLASFFNKLSKEKGSYDEVTEFFMTHPTHESRIEKAKEYKTSGSFSPQPFPLDWAEIRKKAS